MPFHNKHENVICAKQSFIEKGYKQFLVKNEIGIAGNFFLTFFSILNIFMYS